MPITIEEIYPYFDKTSVYFNPSVLILNDGVEITSFRTSPLKYIPTDDLSCPKRAESMTTSINHTVITIGKTIFRIGGIDCRLVGDISKKSDVFIAYTIYATYIRYNNTYNYYNLFYIYKKDYNNYKLYDYFKFVSNGKNYVPCLSGKELLLFDFFSKDVVIIPIILDLDLDIDVQEPNYDDDDFISKFKHAKLKPYLNLPKIEKELRGSSSMVAYDNKFYFILHYIYGLMPTILGKNKFGFKIKYFGHDFYIRYSEHSECPELNGKYSLKCTELYPRGNVLNLNLDLNPYKDIIMSKMTDSDIYLNDLISLLLIVSSRETELDSFNYFMLYIRAILFPNTHPISTSLYCNVIVELSKDFKVTKFSYPFIPSQCSLTGVNFYCGLDIDQNGMFTMTYSVDDSLSYISKCHKDDLHFSLLLLEKKTLFDLKDTLCNKLAQAHVSDDVKTLCSKIVSGHNKSEYIDDIRKVINSYISDIQCEELKNRYIPIMS